MHALHKVSFVCLDVEYVAGAMMDHVVFLLHATTLLLARLAASLLLLLYRQILHAKYLAVSIGIDEVIVSS